MGFVRRDSVKFPGEILNNFKTTFRGVNDVNDRSARNAPDYLGTLAECIALNSTYAWGDDEIRNFHGLCEGEMPHSDYPDNNCWINAEDGDPREGLQEMARSISRARHSKDEEPIEKIRQRTQRQREDEAWRLLDRMGFKPESFRDSNPLLSGMIYVAKLFQSASGINKLVRLYDENLDTLKERDSWYHKKLNEFLLDFFRKLQRRKFIINGGPVPYAIARLSDKIWSMVNRLIDGNNPKTKAFKLLVKAIG